MEQINRGAAAKLDVPHIDEVDQRYKGDGCGMAQAQSDQNAFYASLGPDQMNGRPERGGQIEI